MAENEHSSIGTSTFGVIGSPESQNFRENYGEVPSTNTNNVRRVIRRLRGMSNLTTTMTVLLLFLAMMGMTISPVSALSQQQFRRTPDNQTATVGDMVTLACSIINKFGVLQWTRDGFGLGTERNLVGYERYRMSGSEEEGM